LAAKMLSLWFDCYLTAKSVKIKTSKMKEKKSKIYKIARESAEMAKIRDCPPVE
jgi:hypothetical protein